MSDYVKLRTKLKLNQADFWARVGATQSAGSRYENGRPVSAAMAILLVLAYGSEKERNKALDKLVFPQ